MQKRVNLDAPELAGKIRTSGSRRNGPVGRRQPRRTFDLSIKAPVIKVREKPENNRLIKDLEFITDTPLENEDKDFVNGSIDNSSRESMSEKAKRHAHNFVKFVVQQTRKTIILKINKMYAIYGLVVIIFLGGFLYWSGDKPLENGKPVSILSYIKSGHKFITSAEYPPEPFDQYAESPPQGWEAMASDEDYENYMVPDNQSRIISIKKLNLMASVHFVGQIESGAIDVPWNINNVGWYDGSRDLMSNNGVVLLIGHTHGETKKGAFNGIEKLVAGDEIVAERGDGKVLTFRVISSTTYKKGLVGMNAVLNPENPGDLELNLLSIGTRSANTKDDEIRVFVRTKLVR